MPAHRQDDLLRYMVDSTSKKDVQYAVELELYDGNGGCTCPHFSFRLEPYLRKGVRVSDDRLRCLHILEARRRLVDDVIEKVAVERAPKPPPALVDALLEGRHGG
jgi:hypothetical protein